MSRRCELTGKIAQTGNNVSHANNKTKRRFQPNLQTSRLFSETLGLQIAVRLSNHALRTVEKKGGLDAFLLNTRDSRLPEEALRLKRRVEKAGAKQAESAA
jgi:large subunit ribosomal protein L28